MLDGSVKMRAKMEVVRDTVNPDLKQKEAYFSVKLYNKFAELGNRMIRYAQQLAKARLKRPGSYLEKFYFDAYMAGKQLIFEFGNTHHAARIIELGSRPHRIPSVGLGALYFFKEGEWKFRKVVYHPGTKPTFIIRDTVTFFQGEIASLAKKIAGEI